MTQKISVGFVGADFPDISSALASIPGGPFIEPILLEIHEDTPAEAVVLTSALEPTAANPLILFGFRTSPIVSPFLPVQYVSGSQHMVDPPERRLVPATMTSITIEIDNVEINALASTGDVVITADNNVLLDAVRVDEGQFRITRASTTTVSIRLQNCFTRASEKSASFLLQNVEGPILYHNTANQRRFDAADASARSAVAVIDSAVEAKNNIFSGQGSNTFAIRFIGDPSASTLDSNFYTAFDGAARYTFAPDLLATPTETDDTNQWIAFAPTSTNNFTDDPEFEDREVAGLQKMDVSNTTPALAAAAALADVQLDTRGERRPLDFVTIGAYDHAEVITEQGQTRFLELLGGLSTDPITKTVLADSSQATLFGEFNAFPPTEDDIDELFTPIQIEGSAITNTGEVTFRPSFQVTLPIYGEMLDPVADRADELALLGADNQIFLVKRMHSIPFDSTAFMHTQVTIPISIVEAQE